MEAQADFKEFLRLLNKNEVKYLLVGGYALAMHGSPRNTGDLDIWIQSGSKNAERLLIALDDFGFGSMGLKVEDFTTSGKPRPAVSSYFFTPFRRAVDRI